MTAVLHSTKKRLDVPSYITRLVKKYMKRQKRKTAIFSSGVFLHGDLAKYPCNLALFTIRYFLVIIRTLIFAFTVPHHRNLWQQVWDSYVNDARYTVYLPAQMPCWENSYWIFLWGIGGKRGGGSKSLYMTCTTSMSTQWCWWCLAAEPLLDENLLGGGDSSVVRTPDSWLKGHGFKSLQERWETFLLQGQLSVLTLISISVPPLRYCSST